MSILLYVAGALFVAIGAAVIGFGIPINEFSFGNTLIIAGTVAMVGGLVVLALGVVVRELQYLADMYDRAVARAPKASDADSLALPARTAPPPAAARVPFPPKPKSAPPAETLPREPVVPFAPERPEELPPSRDELPPFPIRRPVTPPMATPVPRPQEEVFGAPSLPNPAELTDFDRYEAPRPAAAGQHRLSEADSEEAVELAEAGEWDEAAKPEEAAGAVEAESPVFAPSRSRATSSAAAATDRPERSYFDAMWPAENESPRTPDMRVSHDDVAEAVPTPAEPESEQEEPPVEEPRTVPILKSGVVDGMGYTLYVDGSIEAELPQGTLRFASINELRAHLEKTA